MKNILLIIFLHSMLFATSYAESKLLDRLEVYKLKCANGDFSACEDINKFKAVLNGESLSTTKPANSLMSKCNKGDAKACGKIAENYFAGDNGYERNIDKSEQYFKLACKLGDQGYCNAANGIRKLDSGINDFLEYQNQKTTQQKNYKNILYSCNNGDYEACVDVAYGYNKGVYGLPKNINNSIYYAQMACDGGVYKGCQAVKEITRGTYECHKNTLPNQAIKSANNFLMMNEGAKARKCYEVACNKDNAKGCKMLGDMYNYGNGAVYNYDTAKTYYIKGCNLGDINACEEYRKLDRKIKREKDKNRIIIER